MADLKGKTLLITGASRGIGRAIALRAARDGANIAILAKTIEPHPKLPGTIFTVAKEIEEAGGKALPIQTDLRFEDQIQAAVEKTVSEFGGIDILVNNASALFLAGTLDMPMKRFDLVHQVNVRATFAASQACIPHLKKASNPHILNLSPPLNMDAHWFAPHVAYTMSKYGMSMCVLGMAAEFKKDGVAVNALWPKKTIATAALQNLPGGAGLAKKSRKPEFVAEAAYHILCKQSKECTGNFFIDEDVLKSNGVSDFESYAVEPGTELQADFFV